MAPRVNRLECDVIGDGNVKRPLKRWPASVQPAGWLRALLVQGRLVAQAPAAFAHAARQSYLVLTYQAVAELVQRYGTAADGLTRFELKAFSQNGEDGVIAEIMRRFGVTDGFFVEFGAGAGVEANCVFLADVLGWRGLFMEAGKGAYERLGRKYHGSSRVSTTQALVTPENVEQLFAAAGVPIEPDILSIDVDGNDYWIWRALTTYRPKLLVIEYNAGLGPEATVVQPYSADAWGQTDFFGASIGSLCRLGEEKGYRLVHTELSGVNAFFIRSDLDSGFPPPESVPRRPPNYGLRGGRHVPQRGRHRYIDPDVMGG